jgi:hypothetical protein
MIGLRMGVCYNFFLRPQYKNKYQFVQVSKMRIRIVATTSSQPTILSLNDSTTDSNTKFERGDMYISDPSKTIQHTDMTTGILFIIVIG